MGSSKRERSRPPKVDVKSSSVSGMYFYGVGISCVAIALGFYATSSSATIASTSKSEVEPKQAEAIYSPHDLAITTELEQGKTILEAGNIEKAIDHYKKLVKLHPLSVQAQYGLGFATKQLSDKKRSNALLEEAVSSFDKALKCPDIPSTVEIEIGLMQADCLTFFGRPQKAIKCLDALVKKYPTNTKLLNKLGVAHCHNERQPGSKEKAAEVFAKVLMLDPEDDHAAAHLGFVRAVYDRDSAAAIPLFLQALNGTDEKVKQDSRFYIHAGDSLFRQGQKEKAAEIFKQAADRGIFLSAMQRSGYNVDRLKSRGWWEMSQLPDEYQKHLKILEKNWKVIRDEGLSLLDSKTGVFKAEDENLREYGDWKQFTIFGRGKVSKKECELAPKTCALVKPFTAAATNKRGQVKFSVLHPGTKVWPHTGPTNCRIRPHLGLKIPPGAGIEVSGKTGTWKEGEFIIIDDSFEHHVWHNGTEPRLILIVDVWHPDLTDAEKKNLHPI